MSMVSNRCFWGLVVVLLGCSVQYWSITETDILYLDMMGARLVVLNNSDVAIDLFERRSVVYADRVRKRVDI